MHGIPLAIVNRDFTYLTQPSMTEVTYFLFTHFMSQGIGRSTDATHVDALLHHFPRVPFRAGLGSGVCWPLGSQCLYRSPWGYW